MKAMMMAAAGAATLLAGCMVDEDVEAMAQADSRLAADLEGYAVAGPAVGCVRMSDLQGNRTSGADAIIFTGSNGRLWVNRTRGSCPSLDSGRALRFRTTTTQLCSGDIAAVFDPTTGVEYGGCSLGDFTPYRRTN